MAVTKQTYTISAGFNRTTVATALRSALIDAGLMTEWYDSFNVSTDRAFRVLRIEHDSTKTYGTTFHPIVITDAGLAITMATGGWSGNVPTGTQYLDYYALPTNTSPTNSSTATSIFNWSTTSNLFLDRYTSQVDTKQSWFVFRQPASLTRSDPFSFLHKDTALHSWLDLNKGCISGFSTIGCVVPARVALTCFRTQNNLRRCLVIGTALRGSTASYYNSLGFNAYSYAGFGSAADSFTLNWPSSTIAGNYNSLTPLPVGKNSTNPAYTTDYVPICTNLPWSYYTPTRLADDFGIYMSYSANDIAYGTKFVVTSTVNEWETVNFANNANVNDGASATFLARVI